VTIIEPSVPCDIFYYNCGNKFNTEIVCAYLESHSGTIIFANGKECIIYEYVGGFKKIKHINANLIKRHKKGGQSQVRFSRLADESRVHYVSYIIDNLNMIKTKNNWLFGSEEITSMIMEKQSLIYVPIKSGGFYDFDSNSIHNTNYWLNYLKHIETNSNDKIYMQIINYLDTKPEYLDFDPVNASEMKWFITKLPLEDKLLNSSSNIKLIPESKYYSRLMIFDYIGIKFFDYDIESD
jgi:hypothetical protein